MTYQQIYALVAAKAAALKARAYPGYVARYRQ